ncbi:protein translocase subunit SecDF [Crocinitomix catalasitica]|uniref:protein translocase subunit SecDF n=1 Tax=Crocinitomix catalasitica TaxID=184607 RepID=UPI000482E2E7|nr:protein translocase subunit SecDF [Crocinitomix catalasitica]
MRNKGFFWSITIALALACIYQLSFTWATSGVEKDAKQYAQEKIDSLIEFNIPSIEYGKATLSLDSPEDSSAIVQLYHGEYIKSKTHEVIHLGYTYAECKNRELNLGLDLKGGMSATLEISVPDLVSELAGKTRNQEFRTPFDAAVVRTDNGEGSFIDLFEEEFERLNPGGSMAKIFHMHNPDEIASDATNSQVNDFLKEQAVNALDGVEIIIEKRVNSFGVAQPTIQKQPGANRVFVELPGITDKASVRRKLQATANLEFYEIYNNAEFGISGVLAEKQAELSNVLYGNEVAEEIIEKDTTSTDSSGISSLLADLTGNDSLDTDKDDLLGGSGDDAKPDSLLTDEERLQKTPITSILQLAFNFNEEGQPVGYREGSVVGTGLAKDTATINARINHPTVRSGLPSDLVFMWDAKEIEDVEGLPTGYLNLHAIKVPVNGARVSGKDIDRATVDNGQIGKFAVGMQLTNTGAKKWESMTEDNLKKQVAITMDNFVYSAPVVQEKMTYSSSITGNFSLYEAQDLAGLLNAGALPTPVKIVDESMVGASLGADNISSGMWSFAFALFLVLVYMVFYYNKAGLVADAALLINVFLLFGALASLKAILTLPGIAGIVLTIGMSVDANVLIFERIREELRNGKGMKGAIKEGYAKALSSILDANITTLLTGIVLAIFGSGPIKGFATTLIIGIFTSFFAAVIITRLIITSFVEKDKKISFSTKMTENWFTKNNVPFVQKRRFFYVISGIVILIGVISLSTKGLDLGVDFAGGRQYKVKFNDGKAADNEAIRQNLAIAFEGNEPQVKMVDNAFTSLITTKYKITETDSTANTVVEDLLKSGLDPLGSYTIEETKMIAPTISKDLKANSFYAIGFSLLIIFLYILFRFKKWQFGLGALIAMAHDVLIVLSIFSICYGWIGFSMEIDQAFIAAILTVVGYSINDTVVVFDRIREYLGLYTKKDRKEVINMALNSTLGRTVNTSVSTFIVLFIIFLFGGDAIKGFVFALMIGVVVGTYSSLFIATPTVVDLTKEISENKN